jgi:hypothetical protein
MVCAAFLLVASIANAVDGSAARRVLLEWDYPPNEVVTFNLYERGATGPFRINAEPIREKTLRFDVPPGRHVYFVTAENAGGESDSSNDVTVDSKPSAPANLRAQVELVIRFE